MPLRLLLRHCSRLIGCAAADASGDRTVDAKPRIRISRDGWIRHDGTPFPFAPKTPVEVVLADGLVLRGRDVEYAGFWHETWWRWQADSWRRNIVFYRIARLDASVLRKGITWQP